MLYAKIFLNAEGKVIFDAVRQYVQYHVYPAFPYVDEDGKEHQSRIVTITQVSEAAISKEAKAALLQAFRWDNDKLIFTPYGDFKFIKYNNRIMRENEYGSFSFAPDEGKSSKTLDTDGEIYVNRTHGFNIKVIEYMQVFDNDFLMGLDITKPYCPPSDDKN